jgi:hypothetical protein
MAAPAPLPENLPFAFRGERLEPGRVLAPREARRLLGARNPTGKSNADVLREFVGVAPDGVEQRRWALDFPPEMSTAQGALYLAPWACAANAQVQCVSPGRDAALRNALARIERFLACPADGSAGFAWIEGEVVPDESLVAWARDDDFSAGILDSSVFAVWLEATGAPFAALASFPFPWPPATPLSALSRAQEELRFAVSRAARAEEGEALEDAVARVYGWGSLADDGEVLERLGELHRQRQR